MEDGRGLGWVVDDDIVDVVVVDDVCDILRALRLGLNPLLLLLARLRTPTAHSESLTVGVTRALNVPLIFALLCHRVLRQSLGTSERSLLVVSVAVDEVVALFLVL